MDSHTIAQLNQQKEFLPYEAKTEKRLAENLLGASSIGVMHGPSCSEKCAKNTIIFINADLTSVLGQPNRYSQNLQRNNCNMQIPHQPNLQH
jgi:hypothetical protein